MKAIILILSIIPIICFGQNFPDKECSKIDTPVTILKSFSSSITWHDCQIIVRDTIPMYSNGFDFTLHSYHNKDYEHDTVFEYNHIEYVRQRISKEIDYWDKQGDLTYIRYATGKIENRRYLYDEYVTCVRRSEYWTGAYKALSLVLYNPYSDLNERFDYPLKTKGIK